MMGKVRGMSWQMLVCGLVCAAVCGGCVGGAVQPSAPPQATRAGARQAPELPAPAEAYARLAAQPGVAGVDYDPQCILVDYVDGVLPPLAPGLVGSTGRAAARPNAQLRRNTQYEALTDAIAQRYGLGIRQQVYYGSVNIATFDVPAGTAGAAVLARLRSEFAAQIVGAVYSPRLKPCYTPNDPDYTAGSVGALWDRWRIRCGAAWDYTLGDPQVIIAVVDTGVRRTHQELSAQVINTQVEFPDAYCDVANHDKNPADDDGHGTFIAGVIAAEADNARTLIGAAPHCRVLPIKFATPSYADVADEIAGCVLAMDLGARVVNVSFGGYAYVPAEQDMVNELAAAGVFFAAAAGNEATDESSYPAAFSNACAVGSTDYDDWCSTFSNWGYYVDVAAPGEYMKSAAYTGDTAYEYDWQGTSFSAPLVAAAAGLLWSYRPELTLSEVRSAIQNHGGYAYYFALPLVRLDIKAALDSVVPEVIPHAGGISVAANSVYGAVPAKPKLDVALSAPQDVVRAEYTLDLPPYNDGGSADIVVQSTSAPAYAAQLTVPASGNHVAQLRAEYFSSTDNAGTPLSAQVYVFNQRGDVNADGAVDLADLDAYSPVLGAVLGGAGYSPFFDSDLNGSINELDAAAVGYFFNGTLPAPQVQSVAPQDGTAGGAVTFGATVQGLEPLSYAWDFGGGAVPNTSNAVAPTVTLGAEGAYNASLVLSNGFGEDTYPFTLTVGPRPAPTASFTATPSSGQPPLAVTFDASASTAPGGSIVNYQWSWDGDTTWEYESATPDAAHTFDTLGDYTVRLRVTDDFFTTAESVRGIQVSDQPLYTVWNEYALGNWGEEYVCDSLRLSNGKFEDRTAVVWCEQLSADFRSLHIALAQQAAPVSLADWEIMTPIVSSDIHEVLGIAQNGQYLAVAYGVDDELRYSELIGSELISHPITTVTGQVVCLDLAMISGKPALYFYAKLESEPEEYLHYAYAAVAHPSSAGDWTVVTIPESEYHFSNTYAIPMDLREVNGLPYIAGQGYTDMILHRVFAYSDSVTPEASDWHWYGLGNDESNLDLLGALLLHSALPQLQINGVRAEVMYIGYALANSAQPVSAANWQVYDIYASNDWYAFDATVVGGVPAIATNDMLNHDTTSVWLARNAIPTGPEEWQDYELPLNVGQGNYRLVDHDSQPALLAVVSGTGMYDAQLVYRYPVP